MVVRSLILLFGIYAFTAPVAANDRVYCDKSHLLFNSFDVMGIRPLDPDNPVWRTRDIEYFYRPLTDATPYLYMVWHRNNNISCRFTLMKAIPMLKRIPALPLKPK